LRYYQLQAMLYNEAGEVVRRLELVQATSQGITNLSWRDGVASIEEPGSEICLIDQGGSVILRWSARHTDGSLLANGTYTISVIVRAPRAEVTETFSVYASVIFPASPARRVSLWPNPARRGIEGQACLNVAEAVQLRVRIYTLAGELLLEETRLGNSFCARVDGLAAGVYLVVVEHMEVTGIRSVDIVRLMVL